jgi:hypothetical protein
LNSGFRHREHLGGRFGGRVDLLRRAGVESGRRSEPSLHRLIGLNRLRCGVGRRHDLGGWLVVGFGRHHLGCGLVVDIGFGLHHLGGGRILWLLGRLLRPFGRLLRPFGGDVTGFGRLFGGFVLLIRP